MSKRVEEGANSTCKGGGEVKRPNSTYGQPEFFRLLSSLKASKELAISDLRNLGENLRLSYNKKILGLPLPSSQYVGGAVHYAS